MRKNTKLGCDVQRYENIPVIHFIKYIRIAKSQATYNTPTNEELIKRVERQFREANRDFAKDEVDSVLNPVIKEMRQNAALTQLTLDYDGAKSRYFFPWLLEVWRSQSSALEMAFNAGYDCAGNWNESIPYDDPFNFFIFNDPTFVYNRERELLMANIALEKQKVAAKNNLISKVLDFGAGRMAWARYTGFEFSPKRQRIRAYDSDKSICPEELFKNSLRQLGVEYEIADMKTGFSDPENVGADLIFLAGVITYLPKEQVESIIRIMYGLLAQDGELFFDLQVDCEYLQRSMYVFKWPELRLPNSIAEAIDDLEAIRKKLKKEGIIYSANYMPDTFNDVPSALMVRLKRI